MTLSLLKELKIDDVVLDLEENQYLYNISVNYDIEDLDISALAVDSKDKVEIEKPEKLEVGENKITIKITKEDGTITSYVIMVERKNIDEEQDNDIEILETNIVDKKSVSSLLENNDSSNYLLYVFTFLLCFAMLLIVYKLIVKLRKYIKNNKKNL